MLKTHKQLFDAFRRHSRFNYELDGKTVETNAAQLRFLKYVMEKGIVDWLDNEENRKKAETAMRKANQISSSSSDSSA